MRLSVRDWVKFQKLPEPSLLLSHDMLLYFPKIPFAQLNLTVSRSAIESAIISLMMTINETSTIHDKIYTSLFNRTKSISCLQKRLLQPC